ncbi:RimK/LysX family protein [Oceanospirillaceae bacterium]|mgnify:FL=1|jgi:hypothetical protein|nr:RimK/LysX family protein [Oceanospirillaceae bacterium]MDC1341497.1 RimK/LysX family protein [Oceanospirillaceae bacterium]|tara:strand:+ start:2740 stop:3177 length:438 start_codon:yes stop_codon:yes gene_type:complete
MEKLKKGIIGAVELCSLPVLGLFDIKVRVDTGAKTSSLHVDNIQVLDINGVSKVQFDIHPDKHDVQSILTMCEDIIDFRVIKSSNGDEEQRYVIKSPIKLGSDQWDIEITLSNRAQMTYLMLLGREGLGARFLVDPALDATNILN